LAQSAHQIDGFLEPGRSAARGKSGSGQGAFGMAFEARLAFCGTNLRPLDCRPQRNRQRLRCGSGAKRRLIERCGCAIVAARRAQLTFTNQGFDISRLAFEERVDFSFVGHQ
jgi:hypothetical protein